jgi:hypothetical protein
MKQMFFLFALLFSFAAQAQDFGSANIKNLLTNGSTRAWRAVKVTEMRKDITAGVPACELDNQFILKADGTFEIREGASKCNASAPDVIMSGTWTYDEGLRYVNFVSGSTTFLWGINTFGEGKISLFWSYEGNPDRNRGYEIAF